MSAGGYERTRMVAPDLVLRESSGTTSRDLQRLEFQIWNGGAPAAHVREEPGGPMVNVTGSDVEEEDIVRYPLCRALVVSLGQRFVQRAGGCCGIEAHNTSGGWNGQPKRLQ